MSDKTTSELVQELIGQMDGRMQSALDRLVVSLRNDCASICEALRPHDGRQWGEGQNAAFNALTDAACLIRAGINPAVQNAEPIETKTAAENYESAFERHAMNLPESTPAELIYKTIYRLRRVMGVKVDTIEVRPRAYKSPSAPEFEVTLTQRI